MSDGEPSVHHASERAPVKATSILGHEITLQHEDEKVFYEDARAKYLDQYTFDHANDLRALERILLLEVQMHRFQTFVVSGKDYDGQALNAKEEIDYHRRMKEIEPQIVDAQKALGLTKAQRDQAKHDSVGGYITQLQIAARQHGINREKQLGKALELTKELFSLAGAWSRSNDQERRKLGFDGPEDIVKWVLEYMKPEFDAIDAHFREHQAKFYRRAL